MGIVSFAHLSEAVDFLAAHLDAGDVDGIAEQCSDANHDSARAIDRLPPPRSYRLAAIRELGRWHGMQSLRTTYSGREFPADQDEFKLGGHGAELGHVHVDFSRTGIGWTIKEIWICR